MKRSTSRIARITLALALIGVLLTTGSGTAGAQDANQALCGSTIDQLVFRDLPPAKRIIIRQGTEVASSWIATIDGASTEWEKPRRGFQDSWLVKVVPADGSSRFTLTCLEATYPITELPFTEPACTVERTGVGEFERTRVLFYGLSGSRPQLRSLQSGWIAGIEGATKATVATGTVTISPIEFKTNPKYDYTDDFFVRYRPGGVQQNVACVPAPPRSTNVFLRSPDLAPPIPADVGVEQEDFFVRTDGEQVVEIVNRSTGKLTILEVSDDYKNPRISPDGRVLWLLDQEEQEEMRIDLDTRLVTRRPRVRPAVA